MDKAERSLRTSSTNIKSPSSIEIKSDSKSSGSGSEDGKMYLNERGQICYGDKCVTLTIDKERNEIVVNVKRDSTCNAEPLIEAIRETLGKKSRTVYEIENE